MTDFYGKSTINISTTSGTCNTESFLAKLPNKKLGVGLVHIDGETQEIYLYDPAPTIDLEEMFISSRGWVFQERLVSVATLHYTEECMVWECRHSTELAHSQNVSITGWKAHWQSVIATYFEASAGRCSTKSAILRVV
jgi:hypothetical protein